MSWPNRMGMNPPMTHWQRMPVRRPKLLAAAVIVIALILFFAAFLFFAGMGLMYVILRSAPLLYVISLTYR